MANDRAARDLELQIKAARKPAEPHSPECLNCGEPSQPGSSYCCKECRDDDEKRKRQLRIRGGAYE